MSELPSRPPLQGPRSSRSQDERKAIRHKLTRQNSGRIPLRIKWTQFMHTNTKNHLVAMIGEFIGTFLFLFFSFTGTEVAKSGTPAGADLTIGVLIYIALAFGISLMVNAWIFYRISGGLFNPAVTLAMTILGAITPLRGLLLFIVQIGAPCFSAYIVSVLFLTPFAVTTTLSKSVSIAQGLFIEVICTTELVFTIIMLAKEKHRATFIAPVGIGFALFLGELIGVYFTGGSPNPARSLGPAAVARNFSNDDWIYWVGPGLGSLLAVAFYRIFKGLEYEMVNPGQDGDFETDPTRNLNHLLARIKEDRQAEVDEIHAIQQEGGFRTLANGSDIHIIDGNSNVHTVNWLQSDTGVMDRGEPTGHDLEAQWDGGVSSGGQSEGVAGSLAVPLATRGKI